MDSEVALLEFDPEPRALLEPSEIFASRANSIPEVAVLCFFAEVIDQLRQRDHVHVVGRLIAAHGPHEIYSFQHAGTDVAVFHPGVGAPLAASFLEEAIAMGARRVVACGGAGVLVPELALGHIVIPASAVRDEGTSFHYLPRSREVEADPAGLEVAARILLESGVPYKMGKTWTTDGLYRETRSRIARRRAEGCITVEMETAALLAVARFRGIRFVQLLYAGDDVSGERWDHRAWEASPSRQRTFDLAVKIAVSL